MYILYTVSVQERCGHARRLDWGLHKQAAGRRHGPLLSPARAFEGVTEGALPQHGLHQDLKHSQTQVGLRMHTGVPSVVSSLWCEEMDFQTML